MDEPIVPYGYCHCGCGQKTSIATGSYWRIGHVKGEPVKFLLGHSQRDASAMTVDEYRSWWVENTDVPYGYCWCGCGAKTRPAKQNVAKVNYVKGEPLRFLPTHHNRLTRAAKLAAIADGKKDCTKCGQTWPATVEYFSPVLKSATGLAGSCRECAREYGHRYNKSVAGILSRKAKRQRRRAAGVVTADEIWQMYSDQDGLCAYCEMPMFGNFHVDHMTPIIRGGSSDWTNLAIACPGCNLSKGIQTAEEFIEKRSITWLTLI